MRKKMIVGVSPGGSLGSTVAKKIIIVGTVQVVDIGKAASQAKDKVINIFQNNVDKDKLEVGKTMSMDAFAHARRHMVPAAFFSPGSGGCKGNNSSSAYVGRNAGILNLAA